MTSSSFSYYYEEEEEEEKWVDEKEEIHQTVRSLVEEIVEEYESIPNSPAPSLPAEISPRFDDGSWNLQKTPSTMSSQSAEIEFSSEENESKEEESSSHFPTIVPKRQPPSYEEVAKRLRRASPQLNTQQQPNLPSSKIPGAAGKSSESGERELIGKMSSKIKELPKFETMVMGTLESGQQQPKLGSGRRIRPTELEKRDQHLKISKNADELKQRPKLSGPQRAFLLFCATLLSLILSSLIVIFVLISFNPNR